MARNTKYDWPNDQELQDLLDEHGTVETARRVGCPPSSLSNRIRSRGLRGSNNRRTPVAANGNGGPQAANSNGKPAVGNGNGNGNPEAVGKGNPGTANPGDSDEGSRPETTEPKSEDKPNEESGSQRREEMPGPPSEEMSARPSEERVRERKAIQDSLGVRKPTPRPPTSEPVEHLGSADYLVRAKPIESDADSAPAGPTSSPNRRRFWARRPRLGAVRRPFALLRRIPRTAWRLVGVLVLTGVAGAAAFISVSNDPKTYQRESSFAVRPSSTVPPGAVNDVIGTLAQPDSAITETIVNMLGSPRLRSFAAQAAGVPASSVGGGGAPYVWRATRQPGSTIIDMRITGPDDDKLLAMQTAAGPEAARLVEESYTPYRLETLSAASPPMQVGPKVARTVGVGLLLGALLGITLVVVERRLRSSAAQREGPPRPAAQRGESWEH